MDVSLESRVGQEVDSWLRWLPRWRPGTHRARTRLCRQCFGSPVIAAAGLAEDVPHAVQHALTMRMKGIVESLVDDFTTENLPRLAAELHRSEERRARRPYRPAEGLDPEFSGLDLDPPASDDAPFLFTFAELADAEPDLPPESRAVPAPAHPLPPLSAADKVAIRAELARADDFSTRVGRALCAELGRHRERMRAAVAEFVEPQVQSLLADLGSSLDSPQWPRE
ncbi:spermidine/putrescine ABC transporter substrate-binding protein [Cryobacterium melibiosiphilum]|uniref:Spermidine/putrescine ABC transporter substrate-binding protein n=1 Tax=Cryobacterium melibiosiphilum TaxID=995039 RepID=A0A3A5MKZ3_9MICO|nr:spermidine/putrescine ABC transporter substrate-binding protein [Cryobacterium melibiosiphilum]RJT88549.1 spermidine/putrescine ABC transporter substrate-binding protein [Cryobacterium melibiosiphilum]